MKKYVKFNRGIPGILQKGLWYKCKLHDHGHGLGIIEREDPRQTEFIIALKGDMCAHIRGVWKEANRLPRKVKKKYGYVKQVP